MVPRRLLNRHPRASPRHSYQKRREKQLSEEAPYINCGIQNRGRTNFGSYSHWIIEDVQDICGKHIDLKQFAECEPATKVMDFLQAGIDFTEISLHKTAIDPVNELAFTCDEEESEGSLLHDIFGDINDDGIAGDNEWNFENCEEGSDNDSEDEETDDEDGDSDNEDGEEHRTNLVTQMPVRSLAEIKMCMYLASKYIQQRKKAKSKTYFIGSVDFNRFAGMWNKEVDKKSATDEGKARLKSIGIRKKSPWHLREFLRSTDEGLKLACAVAGVREKMIDLRKKLKSSTASSVPPAEEINSYEDAGIIGDGDGAPPSFSECLEGSYANAAVEGDAQGL